MFIKRIKKILLLQHVQPINSAKKKIYKDLYAGDDLPTYDTSEVESKISHSDLSLSERDCDTIVVDISVGENRSLVQRRKILQVTMTARYAKRSTMVIIRVKKPRSFKESMPLPERHN